MASSLPTPDPIAKSHSDQLKEIIRAEIKAEGPITFARFMQLALYAPGLGYYSAGARKFGREGDFVTAPEISPIFSWCVANQCQQVLSSLGGGDILELGAGSGTMAHQILSELERNQSLPHHYYILEVSADLKQRQQQFLSQNCPHLIDRIQWLDRLPEQPFSGVILANEVMDAMPIHKFRQQNGLQEIYVNDEDGRLVSCYQPASDPHLAESIKNINVDFGNGYESEINLLLPGWIAGLNDCLASGVMLLVDYGFPAHEFYHPSRYMGTLMCHYRHFAHQDPFWYPGIQDITAHVDFTAVAQAAVDCGLTVGGFTHQAAFLMNCGIVQYLKAEDELERYQQSQQVKQLTLPSEMGELFKVIALCKQFDEPLLGFVQMNQLARL